MMKMLSRYEIIRMLLNQLGVYSINLARDIDSGKEGTFKALGGEIYSYRRIRERADDIVRKTKGM